MKDQMWPPMGRDLLFLLRGLYSLPNVSLLTQSNRFGNEPENALPKKRADLPPGTLRGPRARLRFAAAGQRCGNGRVPLSE